MMQCPECGQMISERATVCPRCGRPSPFTPGSYYYQQSLYPAQDPIQPEPKKGNSVWVIVLSFIVGILIVVAAILIFMMVSKKSGDASNKASTSQVANVPSKPKIDITRNGSYHLTGTVAGQKCTMDITVSGKDVYGTYYYNKYGSPLNLTGFISGHSMYLYESDFYGSTGSLTGRIKEGRFRGKHLNYSTMNETSFYFKAR